MAKDEADSRQRCSDLLQVDGATHQSTGKAFLLLSNTHFSLCHRQKLNLCLSRAAQCRNLCSGSPPVYKDLRIHNDWFFLKDNVDLPIKLKGNSKCTSCNSLSPLRTQGKDFSAALQVLLTVVRLYLHCRLHTLIL